MSAAEKRAIAMIRGTEVVRDAIAAHYPFVPAQSIVDLLDRMRQELEALLVDIQDET